MKKVYILIYTITIILLVGCGDKMVSKEDNSHFNKKSNEELIEKNTKEFHKNNYADLFYERKKSNETFEKLESELSLIPKEYNIDNADKDGYFVFSKKKGIKPKIEIIDKFVSDSQNQKQTSITIVQYYNDEDLIISKIVYDGIKYYVIEDYTRINGLNLEFREFEFKYLKVFLKVFKEDRHNLLYLLLNDKEVTYDQYFSSLSSSNLKDKIDYYFLYGYWY